MPTFTAIAFDRLIEPGASKPVHKSVLTSMPVPNSTKHGRTNSEPIQKKKPLPRPPLKPALYATPEVTPLPDSPSSFPPSPYIINHKRRGPRLLKSFSEVNVPAKQKALDNENVNGKSSDTVVASSSAGDLQFTFTNPEPVKEEQVNGDTELSRSNGGGRNSVTNGLHMEKVMELSSERDGEGDDFFDPRDSMSLASYTDGEDNNTGIECAFLKLSTPHGEFFDAWEELSSEGGSQNAVHDVEAELRGIRLSLLMEIDKRKQAEESLNIMQNQWERTRQELSLVGIVFPADFTAISEGEHLSSNTVEDLCQQVHIARFISSTIGRGTARAEVEMEMEVQLEAKNFEIARLLERLHCYETMNKEMSQRNQEAVEMARRERQRKSRSQRWIWGSITTAITLGTAAIVWSYLPADKGSVSADHDLVPDHDDAAN
ncbi:hypothetical protein Lal_00013417 [Lupinus albus]|uniref:Uncharacterized protein n=1 Tax=Lupinus albus TaxID=3870 RepID=A0A6A5LMS3_LUPAL|nr:hypothetical protein Lalb_Chr09g0333421 [Lupinus albus]KAF1862656.1 hypothetical protein Lal_00013417 [Lupinus albus]